MPDTLLAMVATLGLMATWARTRPRVLNPARVPLASPAMHSVGMVSLIMALTLCYPDAQVHNTSSRNPESTIHPVDGRENPPGGLRLRLDSLRA